jgi:transcriptional regulator with XRE-family HTH domain
MFASPRRPHGARPDGGEKPVFPYRISDPVQKIVKPAARACCYYLPTARQRVRAGRTVIKSDSRARRLRSARSPVPAPATDANRPPPAPARRGPTLGTLIHSLRAQNGWTLKEMSRRTGIPFSTLSKVEHDRLTLTYDKLQQLGERLGLRMSELFADPETDRHGRSVTARRSIGTVDNAVRVNTKNYDYFYLCTELRRKRVIPILTRIRARSVDEFGQLIRHSGEEWIYVLEGRVEVHTEYYDTVTLEPGQSVYIDSDMGHAFVAAAGCESALVIGVCSSAREDHMHEIINAHADEADAHAPARASRDGL